MHGRMSSSFHSITLLLHSASANRPLLIFIMSAALPSSSVFLANSGISNLPAIINGTSTTFLSYSVSERYNPCF